MAVDSKKMCSKNVLSSWPLILLLLSFHGTAARLNRFEWDSVIRLPTEPVDADSDEGGTRWAVLVAGSSGYGNYRHQVGLCFPPFLNYLNYFLKLTFNRLI